MSEEVQRYFGAIDGQSESGTWVHYQDYLALEKRLAEAEAKLRWIPVSERLPEEGQACDVCRDGKVQDAALTFAKYDDGEMLWETDLLMEDLEVDFVCDMWRPRPLPPGKGGGS